jgi:hypothetical protein
LPRQGCRPPQRRVDHHGRRQRATPPPRPLPRLLIPHLQASYYLGQAEALLTEYLKLLPGQVEAEGLLTQLKTRDPTAIATYLHDLEARFIAENKLDRFWQRTPFPFEASC